MTDVPEPEWIDAGHGVRFWVWWEHQHLYYVHDCPMLGNNPSAIPLDLPGNEVTPVEYRWQVESVDPVTIAPSLLCPCGHHGFIRNGRWEPA